MSFLEKAVQFRDNCRKVPCLAITLAACFGCSAYTIVKGVSLLLVAVATINKVIAVALILGAVYTLCTSVYLIKIMLIDINLTITRTVDIPVAWGFVIWPRSLRF